MKLKFLYQVTAASSTTEYGLPPPDPLSLCPLSSTEFVQPPKHISVVRHCTNGTVWYKLYHSLYIPLYQLHSLVPDYSPFRCKTIR